MKKGHFYDFWAVLGRFCIFGLFFFNFLGRLKIFLYSEHLGGYPRVNLNFSLFPFLAVFGFLACFLDFGFSGNLGLFWEC